MPTQKRRENAAAYDFVDESLCEERRPRLNQSTFANSITPSGLLRTSGPFD